MMKPHRSDAIPCSSLRKCWTGVSENCQNGVWITDRNDEIRGEANGWKCEDNAVAEFCILILVRVALLGDEALDDLLPSGHRDLTDLFRCDENSIKMLDILFAGFLKVVAFMRLENARIVRHRLRAGCLWMST